MFEAHLLYFKIYTKSILKWFFKKYKKEQKFTTGPRTVVVRRQAATVPHRTVAVQRCFFFFKKKKKIPSARGLRGKGPDGRQGGPAARPLLQNK